MLILGCTHYPLAESYISDFFGKNVSIVSASKEIAKEAFSILNEENFHLKRGKAATFTACTTGNEEIFYKKAKTILRKKSFKSFAVKNVKKGDS